MKTSPPILSKPRTMRDLRNRHIIVGEVLRELIRDTIHEAMTKGLPGAGKRLRLLNWLRRELDGVAARQLGVGWASWMYRRCSRFRTPN